MTISRRRFVGGVAGAGIASLAAPHVALAQNSGPIRIGLLAAKTGPLASGGIDMDLVEGSLERAIRHLRRAILEPGLGEAVEVGRTVHARCSREA